MRAFRGKLKLIRLLKISRFECYNLDAGLKMEKQYKLINHTADIGIRAYGKDLKQAFANTARGMFSLITDLRKIKTSYSREIAVDAGDKETLLVTWLDELIYLFDTEYLLFKKFDISELTESSLKAKAYGEKVDSRRHAIKIGIKSTTYHMLRIWCNGGYHIQVIFDV